MPVIASTPSTPRTVQTVVPTWYLRDPLQGIQTPIFVEAPFASEFQNRSTEYALLGRINPVVLYDTNSSLRGTTTILTTDQPGGLPGGCTFTTLRLYLLRQTTLLLVSPYSQWYIQILGPKKINLESGGPNSPIRRTTITWVEVDKP